MSAIRLFIFALAFPIFAHSQPATRLDDPFLDNLVGKWEITRKVRGTIVKNTLDVEWVLQHRFIQLHMMDVADPPKYEAIVLIGYDKKTERYVAHWTDIFGGGASAVGYGKRHGNSIPFVFAYPDGPFYNTFTWDPDAPGWRMLLEAEGNDGKRAFFAEDTVRPDRWTPVRFMVGNWVGTTSGQPGEGTVSRQYGFVLGERFIHEKNVSTYPPQERNKKGEVHEHWSFLSYDRARKVLVLRQFHAEGFVNQFALNTEKSTPSRLVFESEGFENLGNKWRARETYEIAGPDEFTEIFELAAPDKPFEVYSTNRFRRGK